MPKILNTQLYTVVKLAIRMTPNLAYYSREREQLQEAYALKVSDDEAEVIVKKLCKHFMKGKGIVGRSLREPDITFFGNRDSGRTNWRRIRLSHNPSLGLICHEVGHNVAKYNQTIKDGEKYHTKKLLRVVAKLYTYTLKHGFWIQIVPFAEEN